MGRKEIQTSRMWKYFVEATTELIEEEGLENITVRKIAERAGYTSSTLYNYFEELSHLIFFASMRFVNEYIQEVSGYMEEGRTIIDKYLLSWECFCIHSFQKPKIYHAIFIANLGEKPEDLLQKYYSVYNSDLIGLKDEIKSLIVEHNLTKRNKLLLEMAVKEGSITTGNIEEVNEMLVLIWQGMMTTILNNRNDMNPEAAVKKTMKYMKDIVASMTN